MKLTDGERDILREQEADARGSASPDAEPDVSDLDDGGFDPDEWCPPDLFDESPPVQLVPHPEPDPEHPW